MAVLLSIVTGALVGFTGNPADAKFHQQSLQQYYNSNPVSTTEQMDRVYAQLAAHAHPPTPPEFVAILQSNPALLFLFGLACWLVFRAGRLAATLVSLATVVTFLILTGKVPAAAFGASLLAYLLLASVVPGLRRNAA